jgi:hypothetical protein
MNDVQTIVGILAPYCAVATLALLLLAIFGVVDLT